MAIHEALYSSRTDEWPTPQFFFDQLNAEFDFTLDPCASPTNTKCAAYFTQRMTASSKTGVAIGCFAIPHMGRRCGNGRVNATRLPSKERWSYCSHIQEPTRAGFTNGYTAKQTCAS